MPLDVSTAKKFFFDRAAVTSKIDAGLKRLLSKFGAFVRRSARNSIRSRKGTSLPGRPPYSHTGILKRFIFFGYDPEAKSVVIGPTLAGSRSGAPERLEEGGVGMEPRPYMLPAFNRELNNAKADFKSLIR